MKIRRRSKLAKAHSRAVRDIDRSAAPDQSVSTHPVLDLQQKFGNQTVHRLIESKLNADQAVDSSVQHSTSRPPARVYAAGLRMQRQPGGGTATVDAGARKKTAGEAVEEDRNARA